jgi:hypothetical protein
MFSARVRKPEFWIRFAVVAGLALRVYHYGRNPSMWHDEAALVLNVLSKGFADLLGPLLFHEAGSPLFLWIERSVHLTLGDSTYALRLIPFLASCAALLLFVPVVKRILPPSAAAWAVLLFAFSDSLLWHSCEAKPYAVDALCATGLLAIYVCSSDWSLMRRLAVYAVVAPVIIFLAYPGCFLFGGVLLALARDVWRARQWKGWLCYGLLIMAIFVSFALLVLGPIHAQRSQAMDECWLKSFPPWDRPWRLALWFVDSPLDVARYACMPTGKGLAVIAVAGAIYFYRNRMRNLLLFLGAPIALALVASCMRAYPFGGTRVMIYAGPAIFVLVAAGASACHAWLGQRTRLGTGAMWLLLITPICFTFAHVLFPWGRADCAGAAAFVRANRSPSDLVAANGWEYLYYFRSMPGVYRPLGEFAFPAPARLWLIVTGVTPEERAQIGRYLSTLQGPILQERDFERTKVFLLDSRVATAALTRPGQALSD